MKAIVEFRSVNVAVNTSNKTGKPYAKQQCGVYLPGEDFAVADEALVEIKDGKPTSYPVGRYETTADIVREGYTLVLKVNYRGMKSIAAAAK